MYIHPPLVRWRAPLPGRPHATRRLTIRVAFLALIAALHAVAPPGALGAPIRGLLQEAVRQEAATDADVIAEAARLIDSGQPQAALERLDRVAASSDAHRDALLLRGRAHEELEQPNEAIAAYQRAIAAAPEWGPPYLQLGLLYLQQDRLRVALSPLERAAELLPDVPMAQVLAGVALRGNGQAAEAVAAFDRALALNDQDPGLWLDAAITRRAAGDVNGAAEAAERAYRLAPDRPEIAVARARMLGQSDDPELLTRAPAAYRAALGLEGIDDAALWAELARTYFELAMHEQAAEAWREVLALDDASVIPHMELAFNLARLELHEQAAAGYSRAIELDPDQGWAYYYRAQEYLNLDREADALADISVAVERLPGEIQPLLAAIELHSERGEHEVADRYLQQAMTIQSGNAQVGLAQAKSLMRQQKPEEALPILEALVAGVPQLLEARYQLGQALIRVGRAEEGRQVLSAYQQLLQEQTANQQGALRGQVAEGRGRVHLLRGRVFLAEGRLELAREQLEAADELLPDSPEILAPLAECLEGLGDETAAAEVRTRLEALQSQ